MHNTLDAYLPRGNIPQLEDVGNVVYLLLILRCMKLMYKKPHLHIGDWLTCRCQGETSLPHIDKSRQRVKWMTSIRILEWWTPWLAVACW